VASIFAGDTISIVHRDRKVEVASNWATVYFQKGHPKQRAGVRTPWTPSLDPPLGLACGDNKYIHLYSPPYIVVEKVCYAGVNLYIYDIFPIYCTLGIKELRQDGVEQGTKLLAAVYFSRISKCWGSY